MNNSDLNKLNEKIIEKSKFIDSILVEISKTIVGQDEIINKILIGLFSNGHILLEGVPGLAKTTIIKTLSNLISTKFQRIQFTPDMLPADLIGTLIFNQKNGLFETKKGPIFSNIILADEINRSPAKVQSALLEAMQERQITIGENSFPLDDPFLVFATQNPIEQEGTYPLPEAQVDRFMMKLTINYPNKDQELEILKRNSLLINQTKHKTVIKLSDIKNTRKLINEIYVDQKIQNYVVDIILSSRNPEEYKIGEISNFIKYGASPRATIFLISAAKARAFMKGRGYVIPEDIRYIIYDVLRHRIIPTFEAEAEEVNSEDIIESILSEIEVP
ncbi:MAG: ATPase [Candidatus Marinimicrobia bacterium]|nr:ATPase [Candidatus Neomarinimicrobiota bacterium]OUW50575.1 MAG: ATPase [bacterium TMED190]